MFPVGFSFSLERGRSLFGSGTLPSLTPPGRLHAAPGRRAVLPRLLQKGTPMLFFIVHDVPGRVRLRARSGFSLRKAQVLAGPGSTPSAASKGCASIPVRGVCSSCMPTTKPSGPRSCCWLWPLRNSLPGMSPCAAKTSPSPAGRPSWGPFLRYIFVRPFMPVLVRVATAVAASVPFILKGDCRIVPRAPQCGCP